MDFSCCLEQGVHTIVATMLEISNTVAPTTNKHGDRHAYWCAAVTRIVASWSPFRRLGRGSCGRRVVVEQGSGYSLFCCFAAGSSGTVLKDLRVRGPDTGQC